MLASQEVWAALVGKSHKSKLELVLPGEEAHSVQVSDYKGSQTLTLGGKVRTRESERVSGWQSKARRLDKEGDGPQRVTAWELSTKMKIREQEVTQMFMGSGALG